MSEIPLYGLHLARISERNVKVEPHSSVLKSIWVQQTAFGTEKLQNHLQAPIQVSNVASHNFRGWESHPFGGRLSHYFNPGWVGTLQ